MCFTNTKQPKVTSVAQSASLVPDAANVLQLSDAARAQLLGQNRSRSQLRIPLTGQSAASNMRIPINTGTVGTTTSSLNMES